MVKCIVLLLIHSSLCLPLGILRPQIPIPQKVGDKPPVESAEDPRLNGLEAPYFGIPYLPALTDQIAESPSLILARRGITHSRLEWALLENDVGVVFLEAGHSTPYLGVVKKEYSEFAKEHDEPKTNFATASGNYEISQGQQHRNYRSQYENARTALDQQSERTSSSTLEYDDVEKSWDQQSDTVETSKWDSEDAEKPWEQQSEMVEVSKWDLDDAEVPREQHSETVEASKWDPEDAEVTWEQHSEAEESSTVDWEDAADISEQRIETMDTSSRDDGDAVESWERRSEMTSANSLDNKDTEEAWEQQNETVDASEIDNNETEESWEQQGEGDDLGINPEDTEEIWKEHDENISIASLDSADTSESWEQNGAVDVLETDQTDVEGKGESATATATHLDYDDTEEHWEPQSEDTSSAFPSKDDKEGSWEQQAVTVSNAKVDEGDIEEPSKQQSAGSLESDHDAREEWWNEKSVTASAMSLDHENKDIIRKQRKGNGEWLLDERDHDAAGEENEMKLVMEESQPVLRWASSPHVEYVRIPLSGDQTVSEAANNSPVKCKHKVIVTLQEIPEDGDEMSLHLSDLNQEKHDGQNFKEPKRKGDNRNDAVNVESVTHTITSIETIVAYETVYASYTIRATELEYQTIKRYRTFTQYEISTSTVALKATKTILSYAEKQVTSTRATQTTPTSTPTIIYQRQHIEADAKTFRPRMPVASTKAAKYDEKKAQGLRSRRRSAGRGIFQ